MSIVPNMASNIRCEPLRSQTFAGIGGAYTIIGTPFDHPIRILYLQNLTDAQLLFSFDGVTDHVVLPSDGFILLDVTANHTQPYGFYFPQGNAVYVKQSGVPTTGDVFLSAFYGGK